MVTTHISQILLKNIAHVLHLLCNASDALPLRLDLHIFPSAWADVVQHNMSLTKDGVCSYLWSTRELLPYFTMSHSTCLGIALILRVFNFFQRYLVGEVFKNNLKALRY